VTNYRERCSFYHDLIIIFIVNFNLRNVTVLVLGVTFVILFLSWFHYGGWRTSLVSFYLFRFFQIFKSTEFGFRPGLSVDYPFSLPAIIICF